VLIAAAVFGRLNIMKRSGILLSLAVAHWLTVEVVTSAQIVPIGDAGTVVLPGQSGQVLIQGGTQAGGNLFHQFQQFGLSAGERATFQVNPTVGNIFSRVNGGQASVINGLLQVTGGNANLFLINPAGVIFGKDARLDLPGSFTATTATALEFSGQKWLSGNGANQYGDLTGNVTGYAWLNSTPGGVVNAGELRVQPGQQVMLSGGTVINTGTIAAPEGKVTIAAVPGEKLIRVTQDNQVLSLDLPVAAKAELSQNATTTINPTQLPQLLAGRDVAEATGIAIAPNGDVQLRSGSAPIWSAQAILSGNVTAPSIDVSGERIDIQEANIDASGATQGGQIHIGGDAQGKGDRPRAQTVQVDQASQIRADAKVQGDGGKVIIWSDGSTQFAGEASAKGGVEGGNGGFVETSGKQTLDVRNARVDASAPKGKSGEWLLDPTDINIANTGTITPATIEAALDSGTNVTISTAVAGADAGDITLTNSINQTGGGTAALTLTGRRFNRINPAQINLTSTGGLTFNINAVSPEGVAPIASAQNAINAIGTVAGARQINLGAGVYVGTPTFARLSIDKDVTIDGGDRNTTQLSGNNAARNVFVAAGTTATINNLAIVNGFTPGGQSGAGILNEGNLTLDNVVLSDNVAGLDGGGIDSSAPTSRLIANNTTFINNRAAVDGGGLFLSQNSQLNGGGIVGNQAGSIGGGIYNTGNLNLSNVGIEQNQAPRGAGIANVGSGSSLTISDFALNNNTATGNGGGLFNQLGTISLTDGSVNGNISGNNGAGIWTNGPIALNQVGLDSNQANAFGGGLFINLTTANLQATNFRNNSAVISGGGVRTERSIVTITNGEFANNQAEFGGGLEANTNGSVQVDNTGFFNNVATNRGGALQNENGAIMVLNNPTFDGNSSAGNGGAIANLARLTLNQGSLTNNQAQVNGGAIINSGANAELDITGSSFIGNRALNNFGGAILSNAHRRLNIAQTTFQNNTAQLGGGAILSDRLAQILTSSFLNNQALGTGGGAILSTGDLNVQDTTFSGNRAADRGGAIFSTNFFGFGNLTIQRSQFNNNIAVNSGGGIFTQGIANITQTDFNNNQAPGGGAIWNDRNLTINNSTFSANRATRFGAGIYNIDSLTVNDSTFQGGNAIVGAGIYNATELPGVTARTTINRSLFDGNIATSNGISGDGGAIYNFESDLGIIDSIFQNNQAEDFGGAIATRIGNGTTNIAGTTFSANRATFGGAIHQSTGELAIANSRFLNNQSLQQGGGLDLFGVTNSSIQQTLIQGNRSGTLGGGINLGGTTALTLDQVILDSNQASTGGGLNGDFDQNFSGLLNINNSTISNNQATGNPATSNGGGIDVNPIGLGGTVNLTNSTVSQNRAAHDGGGIAFSSRATFNIINSTLTQNQADNDGGAIAAFGRVNLTNATIAANRADADNDIQGQGGGIFHPNSLLPAQLNNTIVANNQSTSGVDVSGAFVDQGNNLIGIADGSTGFGNSPLVGTGAAPIDPLLSPLGNYGGLTQTMALLPGSRAIDAGNSAIPTDQRGIARVGVADIGAFESRGFTLVGVGSGQSAQINAAFANPLQVTIGSNFGEPVDGGQLIFTAPTTGAGVLLSSNPVPVTIVGGMAQLALTANPIAGIYNIAATAQGVPPAAFTLTNTLPPVPPVPPVIPPVAPPVPPVVPPIPPVAPPPAVAPEFPIDPTRPEPIRLSPSIEVNPTTLASLDDSFTQEYVQQFGAVASQTATAPQVQSLLSDLDKKRGLRSAVIYAMFVPESFSPQTQVDNDALSSAIPSLLRATERRDSDRLELIFITADGKLKRRSTPYRRSQVEEQTDYFWLANNDVENPETSQQFGQIMQQWLFAPIQREIESAKINGLMYVLDQGLRSLPLASMQTPEKLLIQDYTMSVIPSLGMLDRQQNILKNQTTLAMGASKFEQLAPLPAVPPELAMIQQQGFPGQTFLNEQFTLANAVDQQRQLRPGILHLATHANFNSGEPQNSFIQFNDQRLTLDKIDRLGLRDANLELLILSACNTATGDNAAELGFTGMASLFGVRTAIGSLWSVSDLGTLAFMSEFYGQLRRAPSRSEALRQTQLALQQGQVRLSAGKLVTTHGTFALPQGLATVADTTFMHPYYWSGFTMVGNPW
jgi:filamentous hemagglutinin family protein